MSIPPGERIAVLGDGKLGLLIAQVLNAHGYRVHQFGRHADKLRIAARAGVETEIAEAAPSPSPHTIGWWTPPAVPKDCAPPPP